MFLFFPAFENEVLAIRAQREQLHAATHNEDGSEKPKEADRIGMMDVGVYDNDYYSGDKSKFDGYHTSLATTDDVEVRGIILRIFY